MVTKVAAQTNVDSKPGVIGPAEGGVAWVKVWAAFGVFYGALFFYLMARWLLSGPEPTSPGRDPLPTGMAIAIWAQIALGFIAAPVIVYVFLIRPWRREGRLTFDGMMLIGCFLCFWQDTYVDAIQPWSMYNAHIPNLGSWDNFIPYIGTPAWNYPNGSRVVEPLLWTAPVYIYAVFGFAVFLSFLMKKVKQRWPTLTRLKMVSVCLVMAWIGDLLLESVWLRSGIYIFQGVPTPSWFTLFDGKYYQFPLVEPFFMGTIWAAFACLRYFKNDKGQSIAERGVDQLKVSQRRKTWLSLLAVIGACNLVAIVFGNIPMISVSTHTRAWPDDVINRSYFLNGLCGPGTEYACPGRKVPMPHGPSAHVGPDGKLVGEVPPQTRK